MRVLIACLLSVIIHQAIAETEVSLLMLRDLCPEEGLVGCNGNCTGREFCLSGSKINIDCKTQTGKPYCNPETFECTSTSNPCSGEEKPEFLCPSKNNYYPYATDCSKFWACGSKPPNAVITCPNNLIFDALNKKCAPQSLSNPCVTFSYVGSGLCRFKEGQIVVHKRNKAIFAFCNGDFPKVGECPENHIFDVNKLRCEFECKSNGVFEDPEDPSCYYTCEKLQAKNECCPKDQKFDKNILSCTPL